MDVPSGITKLAMRSDTFARFSSDSRLSGNAAADEAVENAVSNAGLIAENRRYGLRIPAMRSSTGNATNA